MNTNIAKKLTGKVALVTGGSRSIGAAIAKRLAADGASVALTYSASPGKADEVVRSIEAAGGKALALKADAADTEAVRLAVAKTIGTFGGIDILVNNAGTGIFAPIEQFSLEDFEKLIAINVRGLFVATQEAARHLREGGRIIHIGSTNSERMPFVGGSVYALTKGAVAGFTKGLARDLGLRGITVNNVQPLAEVQMATVRNQVLLSMFTDFENYSVFKPDARHEKSVNEMIDQVIAWGGALKALREKRNL